MTTAKVYLGSSSQGVFADRLKCGPRRRWLSNIQWPGFAEITLPNGTVWDAYMFSSGQHNPWPLTENVELKFNYTGLVPPGLYPAIQFSIIIQVLDDGVQS